MMMISALALFMTSALTQTAQSADTVRLDVAPGSKVWIEGGSNLRDWSCKAAAFEARVDIELAHASHDASMDLSEIIQRVTVKVVVRDLKCGNRKMEADLYRALKADDPSTPSHILGIFNASSNAPRQGATLETEGTIAVAGVEKGVQVRITIERLADGTVKAQGQVPLLMTDFGVKPPTGLFGLIRSHNEVVVKFELLIAPPAPTTSAFAAARRPSRAE